MPHSFAKATKIQVVFQGGGAKLLCLMAVVEVLQEFESSGYITIGKSAGSSAGAIAAVMLASGKSMKSFREEVRNKAERYVSKIGPIGWWRYLRVWRGSALYDQIDLQDFFRQLFCPKEDQRVKDLRLPTEIYFTDLYSLDSRRVPEDEPLPTALTKSCRVPLAFSGFASNESHVDGGLALNLPVDHLLKDESMLGRVIGISFSSKFADTKFDSLVNYVKHLFNAAIQASVNRSKLLLGAPNVFSIETDIDTFDFSKALGVDFEDKYQNIKFQFRDWLSAWLKDAQPLTAPTSSGSRRFVRPILSSAPLPLPVVKELQDRVSHEQFTHAELIAGYDEAIVENGVFTKRYRSKVLKRLRIKKKTSMLPFSFQTGKSAETFSDLKFGFRAVDNAANPLPFVGHVQEITERGDDLRSFLLFLFSENPLMPESPNQPYVFEVEYEIDDPFRDFRTERDSLTLTAVHGDADEMIMGVAIPRSNLPDNFQPFDAAKVPERDRATFRIEMAEYETMVPSETVKTVELIDKFDLAGSPGGEYLIIGRRLRNAKLGDCFGWAWDH